VDQVDHGDHDPPWWTRSVQDHRGPRSDISLMCPGHLEDEGVGGMIEWDEMVAFDEEA